MKNLRFVFSHSRDISWSQNLKSRSRDLGHAPFWPIFLFYTLLSFTFNPHAKFEVCIFSHCGDIRGGVQNLKSKSRDPGHAPLWQIFHFFALVFLTINQHAIFEVCIFSHCRDIRGSQNLKSRSRDLGHDPCWPIFHFSLQYSLRSIRVKNLRFVSSAIAEILGGHKIWKVGHVTLTTPPFDPFLIFYFTVFAFEPHAKFEVFIFSHCGDIEK